jgi:hypothetical protein
LKQSEEELDWSQEETSHLHGVETDSEEIFASPVEQRRASSHGIFDLQKPPLGGDAPEEPEVRPGLGTFQFLSFFFFSFFKVPSLPLENLHWFYFCGYLGCRECHLQEFKLM